MTIPIIIILIVAIIALLVFNVRIVPQEHAFILETLGKYSRTWYAGLHFKLPIVQRVVKKISLKEQVLDFPPQPVITKDNVSVDIDSVVFAKVFDAKLYTYGIENPIAGLQNLSATTLRNIIGSMELDQTLTSRDQINSQLEAILDEATDKWGIKVTRVEVKNITPPSEIEEVMTKQMRAERERRQTVLEAQAHQEAVVSRAKGDKEAKILAAEADKEARIALAEGEAESIKKVALAKATELQYLKNVGVTDIVIRLKSLEALQYIADGNATKIFMPTNMSDMVTHLGVLGESFRDSTDVKMKNASVTSTDECAEHHTSKISQEIIDRKG